MLSKIFAKTIDLELEELADFLESNSDKRLSKVNSKIHDIISKNNQIINHINYLLETISHYNVKKEKLQIMEFNLIKASISTLHNETRQILSIVNEEANHLTLRNQTKEFNDRYEQLKISLKTHLRTIEPHFKDLITPFIEKMRDLSENIKQIEETLKDDRIEEYYLILSEIEKLNMMVPGKDAVEELSNAKSSILKLSVRLSALHEKRESMMLTEQFKMSKKTYDDIKELKDTINSARQEIDEIFSPLLPLLMIYNKRFYTTTVNNYIESASQAILNDKNLDIIESLKKIQENIRNEKIKISKNKEEILESIKSINKTKLIPKKQKLEKLEEDYQKKKVLLTKNKVMLDMVELDYQMDHLASKIKKYEDQLRGYEPLDEAETNKLIDSITKKVSKFTDKKIKVKPISA